MLIKKSILIRAMGVLWGRKGDPPDVEVGSKRPKLGFLFHSAGLLIVIKQVSHCQYGMQAVL